MKFEENYGAKGVPRGIISPWRSSMTIYLLLIHTHTWSLHHVKLTCFHFMPKIPLNFVMLGMKTERNCFDSMPKVEKYCIILVMKIGMKLLSQTTWGWKLLFDVAHEISTNLLAFHAQGLPVLCDAGHETWNCFEVVSEMNDIWWSWTWKLNEIALIPCPRLKTVFECLAGNFKRNCFHNMPNGEDYCLILGMKTQIFCFHFMLKV